jgi:hypothetical protein
MIVAFTFILLGYYLKQDAHIYKVAGFTILFLLSFLIIPNTFGSLEYTTGTTILETATGYTAIDITTTYEDFTIGFALTLCSFFGFVNTFFTMRRTDKYE